MHRLHFLIPESRKQDRYEPMYLVLNRTYPANMNSVRRIYRTLRKAGWAPRRARWAVYDAMAISTERGGKGYGL